MAENIRRRHWTRGAAFILSILLSSLMFGACKDSEPATGGDVCKSTEDCDDGFVCEDNVCIEDDGTHEDECKTSEDCDDGFVCEGQVCVKEKDEPPVGDLADYTEACEEDEDCRGDLTCLDTTEGSICTRLCPPQDGYEACQEGDPQMDMECLSVRPTGSNLIWVCYPRAQTYCEPCERMDAEDLTASCGTVGVDLCLPQGEEGLSYCAVDCSEEKSCPEGARCDTVIEGGEEYAVCVPEDGRCKKCVDRDRDGYGNPEYDMSECEYANIPDCDDTNPLVYPGAPSSCNGVDDACAGRIDYNYTTEDGVYYTDTHCGACGNDCGALPNVAASQCSAGEDNASTGCEILECEQGWADCDGDASNGCEADLSDPQHCGACGTSCGGTTASTAVSECVLVTDEDDGSESYSCNIECEAGFEDCDGDPSNGCEVDLDSNSNCGSCGNDCRSLYDNASGVCSNRQCQMDACDEGFDDCNADDSDGCEADLSSIDSCGACGVVCGDENTRRYGVECDEGATPDQNSCWLDCEDGFRDCDGIPNNGCEANIATDPNHCGSCGASCDIANADSTCINRMCQFLGCDDEYGDCDGDMGHQNSLYNPGTVTGCETGLINNDEHCGSCGTDCTALAGDWVCDVDVCFANACSGDQLDCPGDATQCASNRNDPTTCGSCSNNCLDRPHVDGASCSPDAATRCTITSCEGQWRDCNGVHNDGCEVHIDTDANHCGGCGQVCDDLVNAVQDCQNGSCAFVECEPGWLDLDGQPEVNGCPYACEPQPGEDRPGDITQTGYATGFHDTNCDGIDGDASRALFVDRNSGNDSNPGTRDRPLATINAALTEIVTLSGKDQIYVSRGTYNESILLVEGVSIYGGYDASQGWRRSAAYESEIRNTNANSQRNVITVTGENIGTNGDTYLQNLKIVSGTANAQIPGTMQGASSYAIHCSTCAGLQIIGNNIEAGTGAAGRIASTPTSTPVAGGKGGNGGNGDHDGSSRGAGGTSGASSCGRAGGGGGRGAPKGKNTGDTGGTGAIGTPGGSGGSGGDPGRRGNNGSNGSPGANGGHGGAGAAQGAIVANGWHGGAGGKGTAGSPGNGGGGGGGGGGQGCTFCVNGAGNGGGGGGGGGCGGEGGNGGGAGGGSFGVFAANSTGLVLLRNTIVTNAGGNGGAGTSGLSGASGGAGGAGATHKTGEIGAGGNGGDGGNGGRGGSGGGGAGGPSAPILTKGMSNSDANGLASGNTLNHGDGGDGGTSGPSGNNGQSGIATPLLRIP